MNKVGLSGLVIELVTALGVVVLMAHMGWGPWSPGF
jgi:hypothetical protein